MQELWKRLRGFGWPARMAIVVVAVLIVTGLVGLASSEAPRRVDSVQTVSKAEARVRDTTTTANALGLTVSAEETNDKVEKFAILGHVEHDVGGVPGADKGTASGPGQVLLAVVIDNAAPAVPQSGLAWADVIYEVPSEGGVSELLAVYRHAGTSNVSIGPVRGASSSSISLARQYGAALAHTGASPQALRLIRSGKIQSIGASRSPGAYLRDPAKQPPYDLYTSTARLFAAARNAGLTGPGSARGLACGESSTPGAEAQTVDVPVASAAVRYVYDAKTESYWRSVDGKAHYDGITGSPLTAKNVIVQFTRQRTIGEVGGLDIALTGEGRAIFFIGGKRVEGRWIRRSETESFRYEDSTGGQQVFTPGQTWVEVVGSGARVTSKR